MSDGSSAFEEDPPRQARRDALVVSVEGYEGPLDLLLTLARRQKVDLARISVLQLAEQYLEFLEEVHNRNLEIAAEYLVMAAWLTFLKSRLLLSEASGDEEPAVDEAEDLAFRLCRLEAMRTAGDALFRRPLLGEARFPRGMAEPAHVRVVTSVDVSFRDLLVSYADIRRRRQPAALSLEPDSFTSVETALGWIREQLHAMDEWTTFARFLPRQGSPVVRRSALAATLAASLEMVKTGSLYVRQDAPFGPILLRASRQDTDAAAHPSTPSELDHGP